MDFSDTFAPVTRLETIRLMLAIAVQRNWEIRQIDVKTAYLHGELDEEIFMEPPEGFPAPNGHVYRLKKALYGLKQAGQQWYFKLKSVLNEFGFTQIECEPHTFVVRKVVDGIERTLVLPVYVDDLLPIGDKVLTDEFERNIGKYFDVTLSGDASYFLGIQLQRDRLADPPSLILNQHKFVQDILHRIDHDGSTATTPLSPSTKLVENPSPKEDASRNDVRIYQSLIGTAMYLMLGTRPDLAFAVGKLAQFSVNPSPDHQAALHRLFNYISWSKDFQLEYIKQTPGTPPLCHTDADFTADPTDRISVCGYIYFLNGGPFSWYSKKQSQVATSTAEAEYTAIFQASQQACWVRQFLEAIGKPLSEPLVIYSDSQSALAIAKGTGTHSKSKHFDTRYHAVRNRVRDREIELRYISTEQNAADFLTKQLPRNKFHNALANIGFDLEEVIQSSPEPANASAEETSVYLDPEEA